MPSADEKPTWQPCPNCDEYWCNLHQMHVFECDCPRIEEWDHDPYEPRTNASVTVERPT